MICTCVLVYPQVIALLLTCGSYFNKGSAKRRLDRFFTFMQAYVLAKNPLPLDIDADLQVQTICCCFSHSLWPLCGVLQRLHGRGSLHCLCGGNRNFAVRLLPVYCCN